MKTKEETSKQLCHPNGITNNHTRPSQNEVLEIVNCKSEINEFEMEQDSNPREHVSAIKIKNKLRKNTEEVEINTFPISTLQIDAILAAELRNEPSVTLTCEQKIILSDLYNNETEPISEVRIENKFFPNAASNLSLTANNSSTEIIENVSIKEGKSFECKICSKKLGYTSDLKRHVKMVHDKIKPF